MLDLREPENINGSGRNFVPRFDFTPGKNELNKVFVYALIACWQGKVYQKLISEIGNIKERNVRVIVKKLKDEGKIEVIKRGYNSHGLQQPNIYKTSEPEKRAFDFSIFKGLKDSKAIGLYMWMRGYMCESKWGNPYFVLTYGQCKYFKEQLIKLVNADLIKTLEDDDGKVKIVFIKERYYPHLKYE